MHPRLLSGRRRSATWLSFSVLLLAGCGIEDESNAMAVAEEVPSPAGPGSGEPFVSTDGQDVVMSWLERVDEGHDLRFARYDGTTWSEPITIAHRSDFFVNWADFPSVRPGPGGSLWAHWLQRGPDGGYDYGIRIVHSTDGGRTWSEAWSPHEDGTPTEHGFVSAFREDGRMGFVWLDGRETTGESRGAMTLRFRDVGLDGADDEVLLDGRVCDCCQTASTLTADGPVVVYRNRTEDEIRDIYVTRRVNGTWTEGMPVYDDGWEIAGCPVNGPAVDASGRLVAVAWFAAPQDEARVRVAFSADAGASFGDPVVVDDGNPAGRVDVLLLEDGSALVTWLERTGGDGAEVRMRLVAPDGSASGSSPVSTTTSTRPSGFPRIAELGDGTLLVVWTDARGDEPMVRTTELELVR
jgi:hypothetical protein